MNIALFGGTFNPIHKGHLDIIHNLANEFDEVWVIPSYITPEKKIIVNLSHRNKMINYFISGIKNVKICNIEVEKKIHSYTIFTIKELVKKYHEYNFTFAIGFDNVKNFHKWNKSSEIAKLVKLRAYYRNKPEKSENIKKYNMELIKLIPTPISSSNIRSGITINTLDKKIRHLLLENKLYINEITSSKVDKKLYDHCLDVATYAMKLAKIHGLNEQYAYIAGMFHDITKQENDYNTQVILDKLSLDNVPPSVAHQYTGAYFVEYNLGIENKDIISSIKKHTTASVDMNKFEKIIYIADKISPMRDNKKTNLEYLRNLAINNIDSCFVKTLQQNYDFLEKKNIELSTEDLKIKSKWIKKT